MTLPWTRARDLMQAAARHRREQLLHAAVAARVAQADEKGWKQWLATIGAERF